MNFFTRENITAKLPGFALFIIYCPVFFNLAPGNELAALAFVSLIKVLCIQYVARKGKKAFLLIKTWPFYIIAASNLVSGFYLMNSDPKIYIAGAVICLVSAGVGGCYTIPLPQNAASSEGTEFESPFQKVEISV